MADEYNDIHHQIDEEIAQDEYSFEDTKITHVENLFIISYLTKAIQDLLIRKSRFFQYPLLLVDLPLALAILIVNLERIVYVKMLGYVLAHIQYDVAILKSIVMSRGEEEGQPENWQERAFDTVRKVLRFLWGLIILLFILPVWPLIWIYNHIVQTLLIAIIYYCLMFVDFVGMIGPVGGYFVYYLLLATVTFLVSSITVPFIFQLSVYFKELFSLERKTWKQVHSEAKMSFVKFYQRLHGKHTETISNLKSKYTEEYKAEGGVYYMLLKFLHYMKDKFWKLKERKMEAVVEKIQDTTVDFVDDYYQERRNYYFTLRSLSSKDLRRTIIALVFTILFAVMLVFEGANGKGLIGPILMSFVDQSVSQTIWIAHHDGHGYYEDMIDAYVILPNFLKYIAIGFDQLFHYFFQAYYVVYPVYLDFIGRYYWFYANFFVTGILYGW